MSKVQFANRGFLFRTAAVAGYVAVMAIAILFTWSAFSGIGEQRASIAATEAAFAQLTGRSPSGQQTGDLLAGAPAGSPFLEGQTLNVAGAALLQRVASIVNRVGGNVLSSQVDLESDRAKDGWISLLVSCDVEQPALQKLLYDVEAGMPFLFIDQLVVQAPTPGLNGNRMRVLLTVSGQWWKTK
jgi:general secretion pathway protein M